MDPLLREILDKADIKNLMPHQDKIIRKLEESDKSLIISAPTSSGKTLPVIWLAGKYVKEGKRVIYAVPSIALVNEKVSELRKLLGDFARVKRVGEKDAWKKSDIVCGTFDQLYLYFLKNIDVLKNFSLMILDDFHILYHKTRGFTIEKLVTLALMNNIRIVAMSATIEPLDGIAEWIGGEYLKYGKETRIVPLSYKVLELEKREDVVDKIEEDMKPCIIFCSTKQYAETRAQKLAERLKSPSLLAPLEKQKRKEKRLSIQEILDEFDKRGVEITEYEEELAKCIARGVAWHHSDVDRKIRELIEEWYNERYIDFLFATTTLAYGFNSPTRTVIIADIMRWDRDAKRSEYIPVHEWLQMAGRAGRLGLSEGGIVYTCVRSKEQKREVELRYHAEKIEECESSIIEDDFFRKAILELIYAGMNTDDEIKDFFSKTYYYTRGKRKIKFLTPNIEEEIANHIKTLYELGFIYPTHAGYKLTDFGKIVVEFLQRTYRWYELSDLSRLREDIKNRDEIKNSLEAIVITLRYLKPLWLEPSEGEGKSKINEYFKRKFGRSPEYYEYTAFIVLREWINGRRIEDIQKEYGRWAIYVKSIAEDLSEALKLFKAIAELEKTKLPGDFDLIIDMVKYGLSKYEIPLIKVKGFGRVRIHNLYMKMTEVPVIKDRLNQHVDETIIDTLIWYFKMRGEKNFREDLKKWKVKYIGEKMIDRLIEHIRSYIER